MSLFRNTRGQRNRFRPTVEGLEDRTVPAGNVTALISGGNLFIAGDGDGNALKVQGNSRGTIDLSSMDSNTIINGQPGQVTLVGFSGGIYVDMGDGFDALQIDNVTIRGNLSVEMGNGNDMLVLTTTTVKGIMDIKTGEGNDRVAMGNTVASRTAFVNIGNGDNQINLLGVQFKKDSYFAAGVGSTGMGMVNAKFNSTPGMQNIGQRANAALPLAVDDTASVAKAGTVSINVAANDVPIAGTIVKQNMVIIQQPANGTAVVNGDGTISYTHNGSNTTTDSFTYIVQNSKGGVSNQGKVTIAISGTTATAPTVTVTSALTSPTNTNPLTFTATFSEAVTGFTASGLTVTNGTVTNFVATSGSVYTFGVIPTGQGDVSVTVNAGAGKNSANVGNTVSATKTLTFDSTAPTLTVTPLVTNDTTPTITGTVSDSAATVKVTVNSVTVNATVTGTTWSANFTTALAAGTYSVSAVATDPAGNTTTTNAGSGLIIDLTPPTVSITSTQASPATAPFTINILFSKDVTNFVASDIVVTNGTISNFTAVSAKSYTATVSPAADGTVLVNIAANVANDTAGNGNEAAAAFSIVFNSNGAPSVALTTSTTSPTNTSPILFTATFSASVTGFALADINVVNGTASNFTAVSGTTYTFNVTPTGQGVVAVSVPANVATNATNQPNLGSLVTNITFDTVAVTVAITSTTASPTSGPFPISVVFNEEVTQFVAADIVVTNGTLSNFAATGNGKSFTATVTPTSPGVVSVNIAAGAAKDLAGNDSVAGTFSITFASTSAPTVAQTLANLSKASSDANTTILLPGTFDDDAIGQSTVTFKVLKGTTPLDIHLTLFDNVAPLTVANFFNYLDRYAENGGTLFHRLNLQTGLNVIQGGGYTFNSANNTINPHIVTDSPIRNEYNSAFPNNRGTISMAKLGGDPNSATSEFFFNLDDANANTLGSNNNGGFTVFGKVATADLAILDSLASVPIKNTGGFSQLPLVDGNTVDTNNILRVQSVVVDHRDDQLSYSVTSSNPAVVSAVAGGFQGNQLTLDYLSGGTSTITVTATNKLGLSATTSFVVTVAGNAANLTATLNPLTTNATNPTLTGTVSDPTATVNVTVNGQTVAAAVTGSNWSAPLNFLIPEGTHSVAVAASTAAGGTASFTNATGLVVDRTAPTVAVTSSVSNPTNSLTIPITVTFSENVVGFTAADIGVTNGTLSGFTTVNGTTYTATVTANAPGLVLISVPAGGAADAAGNGNTAATTISRLVDQTPPAATISSTASNPTTSLSIPIEVTFTEKVFGFTGSDIAVTNGTLSNFDTADGITYTATVTASGIGTVTVSVPANVTQDGAANGNLEDSFSIEVIN